MNITTSSDGKFSIDDWGATNVPYPANGPLTKPFNCYLTDLEPSGKTITIWPLNLFKYQLKGIDMELYKRQCEEIDNV